jgi:cytochrome bd-type quinol oxidase subunit 2
MKKSKLLLVNSILATLYSVYLIANFANAFADTTSAAEQAGASIAMMLVAPHAFVTVLGMIFGWLAYVMNKTGFALTSAILYSVAAGLFILYAPFLLPMIVIGFIAYSKVKKVNKLALQ